MTTMNNGWKLVSADTTTPPFSVFTNPIIKSDQDQREYRVIQLENGLQATLVHDPDTDKAAASLDVAVGHLFDPDDMPGLAHFCEHLLFMGTEQFPKENEYSEYLSKHNGNSNAYTSTTNTNYYFSVSTAALPGALHRFSAFFHCPLFSPSCTSRELNAVDSEHKKNHQADTWRIFQLNKHLSKPGHVWSKFGSGSRESLSRAAREKAKSSKESVKVNGNGNGSAVLSDSAATTPISSRIASPAPSTASNNSEAEADGGSVGREIRRRLVEWWEKEYCASRMRLCVIGKESLDELSTMVSSFFSPIQNRGRDPLPMIPEHPFGEAEKGTLVAVQTIMSFHALEISFPVEYQAPFWRHKPTNFISHFIGHEGPGSLHSYLKGKGWVTQLSSGPQELARGFAMFKVTIHLTKDGFANYEKVILATYQYLALLRSSPFEEYHHREVSTLSKTRFRFAEKQRTERYATWISEHMGPFPPEHVLDGPKVTWGWHEYPDNAGEKKVREYLESNLRIGEGRVVLMAREDEHLKVQPGLEWSVEPWYGTKYSVRRFDEDFVKAAESPNQISQLFLPGPNEFIPKNLDVDRREVGEPAKRPYLIRQTAISALWHKKDDRFWVPKAHVVIDLRSPVGNASPRTSVLTRLYSDLVNDSLTEYAYDADLAGLSYNFIQHTTGLYVSMNGYNDKMAVLVQHVLEKIKGLVVNPERLAIIKEQAKRDWENFFLGQSYTLSDYFGRYLLAERQWTLEEKLKELQSVTPEEVQSHIKTLLSEVNMRILVVGNMYKDEAIKIAEIAEQGLPSTNLTPADLNDKSLILPEGSTNHIWSLPVPNPQQPNSALTYYTHFGPASDQRLRVISSLLTQLLTEPAFNILRTKEQLGYIVFCSAWSLPSAHEKGLRIVVQSEKGPVYFEQRVEAFLDTMRGRIEEMSLAEFESQKGSLEKKWLEEDKNLSDETGKYMVQINSGHLDFYRNSNDAVYLKSVTKEEVLEFFLSHVHPSSPSRAKLSIHMKSIKPRPKKVSNSASLAFEALLHEAKLDVPEGWREPLGDMPTLQEFVTYWFDILKDSEGGGKILALLPEIVKKYPVDGEQEDLEKEDAVYIKDVKAFKAGLKVSVDPGALVQWGDLPVSKF
ncbi:Metalloenzyme, LuxS/M16 peptidase-like protein [Cyathus striatus]|nr:Metalloenzyme, LuxS/M16 peptidase-like protein [Cyathus striatus]